MKKLACLFLLLIFTAPVFADIPPPKPTQTPKNKDIEAQMRIEPRAKASEARLIIPKNLSKQMLAEFEGEGVNSMASLGGSNLTPMQTVAAGLLLSMAFVFGGVWFVKSSKESNKTVRAALIFIILFAGVAIGNAAFANAGPPQNLRVLNTSLLSDDAKNWGARGNLKVELSDTETQIVLILPEAPKTNNR